MSDPYVGEIRMFGGTFVPSGWLPCDGSLLSIPEYQVLFTVIGTIYGGDGVNNFAVPDLRGRVPINQGAGPGLSPRTIGQSFGSETVTLTASQAPHTHVLQAAPVAAPTPPLNPAGNVLAQAGDNLYSAALNAPVGLQGATVSLAGGGQAHQNMMPSLCVPFIISPNGIFPSQG
ncbi:MAG TPA: tail fiber protein [bacterium]|jgi:microcystin-dependent protein|nr:tail fiber protein [bacterium]